MKQIRTVLLITFLLTFTSCDLFNLDQEPTLPEITQEGAGTFGCLIDGELFLHSGPDPTGGMRGNPHATYTEISGSLIVQSQNSSNWRIALALEPFFKQGQINFIETSVLRDLTLSNCASFYLDTSNTSINISLLDIENDIISGTFSGNYLNECDSTNVVEITQGRFDLVYTL